VRRTRLVVGALQRLQKTVCKGARRRTGPRSQHLPKLSLLKGSEASLGEILSDFDLFFFFFLSVTLQKMREALLVPVRRAVVEAAAPVTADLFDAVQTEAYTTMQFSLYPAYLAYLNVSRQGAIAQVSPGEPPRHDSTPSLRDCLCKVCLGMCFSLFHSRKKQKGRVFESVS
jgi:hypothetical protein